jgi:hypothetical protein
MRAWDLLYSDDFIDHSLNGTQIGCQQNNDMRQAKKPTNGRIKAHDGGPGPMGC